MRSIAILFLAGSLALGASCSDKEIPPPTPVAEPAPCEMPVDPPQGYRLVTSQEVEQGPTLGVRTFYSAEGRRHIVYTAGVLMDFFEEPPTAKLRLQDGSDAWLFGSSRNRWILFWYQDDACKQYSIGGEGLTRAAFVGQMRELGVLPEG